VILSAIKFIWRTVKSQVGDKIVGQSATDVQNFMKQTIENICSELSSGIYCRVKLLSTDVSEVRTASIIPDEDNSEHHTRRLENLKSHILKIYVNGKC
jgi:hypothetical protein